jgi:hypothetical protein
MFLEAGMQEATTSYGSSLYRNCFCRSHHNPWRRGFPDPDLRAWLADAGVLALRSPQGAEIQI